MSVVANHMISNPVGRWRTGGSIHEKEHVDRGRSYRPQVCEVLSSETSMQEA